MEPKTSFALNTAATVCEGRQTLNFYKLGEIYEIKPAQVAAGGVIWGTRELIITGEFTVTCKKTGLGVKVNFNHNSCNGSLFNLEQKKKKLFVIDGKITENVKVQDLETKKIYFLYQTKTIKTSPIKTDLPINKQESNESRRVWHNLTVALNKFDYDSANEIKNQIESNERKIEEIRKKNNEPFVPKLFKKVDGDWIFLNPISQKEEEKLSTTTNGIEKRTSDNSKGGIVNGEKTLRARLTSYNDFKKDLPIQIIEELKNDSSLDLEEDTKELTDSEFEEIKQKIIKILDKKDKNLLSSASQDELENLQKQLSGSQVNLDLD